MHATAPHPHPAPTKKRTAHGRPHTAVKTRWKRLPRNLRIAAVVVLVLLIGARIALPYVLKSYVQRKLKQIPEYTGDIRGINVHLWRGAYVIQDLNLWKMNGTVPVPFFSAARIDLSMQWKELFHGAIVGEIAVQQPRLNFVAGPTEEKAQTKIDKSWADAIKSLFPFRINRFQIEEGEVHFQNFHSEPPVNIFVQNLSMTATNITNARDVRQKLPAGIVVGGSTLGGGQLHAEMQWDPLAENPTFQLQGSLTNMDMTALNGLFQAYGKFDVASGDCSLFVEMAASEGKYEGYVKPILENIDVFAWKKERQKNILQKFWQAIVGGTVAVFKNHSKDRLATKIPISGNFENTRLGIWAAVGGILQNAFIRAMLPKLDHTESVEQVEKTAK
ncbi:MAG: hypothetical protein QOF48_2643 [Verrucomicrobiota bacterium]|jgi:hypothetical protein